MSIAVRPDDERLTWAGAVSLQHGENWVAPWRVPFDDRALFHPVLLEKAETAAGVRIRFRSATTAVSGAIASPAAAGRIDVCVNGEVLGSEPLEGRESFAFRGLPEGEKDLELWLPQQSRFQLRALEIDDGASLASSEDRGPRWITYGSSITHCGAAASPAYTWPAIVAREAKLNLTCLGYGGQCHLDSMVARMMRDLSADYLSMCVGINIYGAGSLGPRAFGQAIIGFVQTVREKHPDVPYAVMSPIWSPPRETTKNAVGFTLSGMRDEVANAVEALRAHGDANVHYVDGLSVFGRDLEHLLPDQLHPNAEGYKVMGRNFLREVAKKYFVRKTS